jgi:hypothetical protein
MPHRRQQSASARRLAMCPRQCQPFRTCALRTSWHLPLKFPGHADPTDRRGFPIDAPGEKRTRTTLAVFAGIPGRKVETTKKPKTRENLGTVQTIAVACTGAQQLAEISSISFLSLFRIRDSGQSIACPRTRHNFQTSLSHPTRPGRMVEFPPRRNQEPKEHGSEEVNSLALPPSRHRATQPASPKEQLFLSLNRYCSEVLCRISAQNVSSVFRSSSVTSPPAPPG